MSDYGDMPDWENLPASDEPPDFDNDLDDWLSSLPADLFSPNREWMSSDEPSEAFNPLEYIQGSIALSDQSIQNVSEPLELEALEDRLRDRGYNLADLDRDSPYNGTDPELARDEDLDWLQDLVADPDLSDSPQDVAWLDDAFPNREEVVTEPVEQNWAQSYQTQEAVDWDDRWLDTSDVLYDQWAEQRLTEVLDIVSRNPEMEHYNQQVITALDKIGLTAPADFDMAQRNVTLDETSGTAFINCISQRDLTDPTQGCQTVLVGLSEYGAEIEADPTPYGLEGSYDDVYKAWEQVDQAMESGSLANVFDRMETVEREQIVALQPADVEQQYAVELVSQQNQAFSLDIN